MVAQRESQKSKRCEPVGLLRDWGRLQVTEWSPAGVQVGCGRDGQGREIGGREGACRSPAGASREGAGKLVPDGVSSRRGLWCLPE